MSAAFDAVSASAYKHFQNNYFSKSIYQFRVDRAFAAKTVDEVSILARVKFSQILISDNSMFKQKNQYLLFLFKARSCYSKTQAAVLYL